MLDGYLLACYQKRGNMNSSKASISFLFLNLIIIFSFFGCVPSDHVATKSEYYPKVSEDADILLQLTSNVQKTAFFIDGKKIATGRRVKVLINERPHTVRADPEDYASKEEFIQPPYMKHSFLNFTFLIGEKIHPITTQTLSLKQKTKSHIDEYTSIDFAVSERTGIEKKWAIIIGISEYLHSEENGISNLSFADDDAVYFAQTLKELGWKESHINLMTNRMATRRNIMIALESWLTKAGPNDQIILFWAGHGYPDPEDPEKVYFACYDTDISIPVTGYRMDNVRTAIEEKKAKNVIILADTCHAGKLITRGSRSISIVPQIEKMKNRHAIPKGWVFMVGADTDRQAIEHSSWRNGAFTHTLLKGLKGKADGFQSSGEKDGIITMGELKEYLHTVMPTETLKILGVAKRPVITTSTGNPEIWNINLQILE
jgi:hypothetical protein